MKNQGNLALKKDTAKITMHFFNYKTCNQSWHD